MNPYLERYAESFLGVPYIYGGNSHLGIDCSGLVIEILKSCGMNPPTDMSANDLHKYYLENGDESNAGLGALVFFGKVGAIVHIGFCVNNLQMIEAAGGNSFINTVEKAYQIGACVKKSMINRRKDLVGFVRPRYELRGWVL